MKKYNKFRPRIRSKNFSCDPLRHTHSTLGFYPFRSVIRFGSTTPTEKVFPGRNNVIELNTVDAIRKSSSKLLMKKAFAEAGVPQSEWWTIQPMGEGKGFYNKNNEFVEIDTLPFPILAKKVYGSKGKGMVKLNSKDELNKWLADNNTQGYYFEAFHNYAREYRLHVSKHGCFYGLRKMLKSDTPDDQKWFRNDSNCVWMIEENELFDRPVNWDKIEADCVNALNVIGLDTGAFDVKIQSSTTIDGEVRENPEYILIEVNSAPSMGDITVERYKSILPKLLVEKYETS
ncbi:MAG: hypothetical protein ACOC3V_00400 [bacterium]